jgi:phage shock protein PspC (stress-responsive transcriptional regulator)
MTTTIPLHTNHTKKIVFIFAFLASSFFNILLFSSIGGMIILKIVWGAVGQATVFFQTVELRNYFNIKRKIKYLHLIAYAICTIGSIAGTLGAGYAQIEKSRPTVKMVEINQDRELINRLLKKENINQWAALNFLKQKKKLNQKSIQIKHNEKNISSSLNGIAKIFNVSTELVAFIFLIFVACILELMVFGSATFTGKLFNKNPFKFKRKKSDKKTCPKRLSKIEKEIKNGQNILKMMAG